MNLDQMRTVLANERTFLAYVRTALSLMIFGMAVIKFFSEQHAMLVLGWVVLGLGILLLIWGSIHCRHLARLISREGGRSGANT
ncbi:MAG: DUF202 domain-containing protein [Candidatus Omnitrophota bacterium]